jgi:hypothetical protein
MAVRLPARRFSLVALTLLAGAGAVSQLGGCYLAGTNRWDSIRSNPSPNISTLSQRPQDVSNAMTVTFDEDLRMFNEDLGRAFYTDRPSRLTKEPMPH